MLYERESRIIVPAFFGVHHDVKGGQRESVYRDAMRYTLEDEGLTCETEKEVPFYFRGRILRRVRLDLLVEGKIILECKARSEITSEHCIQLLHYLKSTGYRLGYVLNFGDKPTYQRRIHDSKNPHPFPPP